MSETEKLVPQDDLPVEIFESEEHDCAFTPYPEGDPEYGQESTDYYRRCACGNTYWTHHCRCEQPHRACGNCRGHVQQTLSDLKTPVQEVLDKYTFDLIAAPVILTTNPVTKDDIVNRLFDSKTRVGLDMGDESETVVHKYTPGQYNQFEGRLRRHQQDYIEWLDTMDYETIERRLSELLSGKRLSKNAKINALLERMVDNLMADTLLESMEDGLRKTTGVDQVMTFNHLKSRHDTSGQDMEHIIVLDSMSMYKPLTYNVTPFVQDSYLYESILPEVPQLEKVDRENRKKKFSTGANEWQARKLDAQTTPYVNRTKSKRKKRSK